MHLQYLFTLNTWRCSTKQQQRLLSRTADDELMCWFCSGFPKLVGSYSPSLSQMQNLVHEPSRGRTHTSGVSHRQGKAICGLGFPTCGRLKVRVRGKRRIGPLTLGKSFLPRDGDSHRCTHSLTPSRWQLLSLLTLSPLLVTPEQLDTGTSYTTNANTESERQLEN